MSVHDHLYVITTRECSNLASCAPADDQLRTADLEAEARQCTCVNQRHRVEANVCLSHPIEKGLLISQQRLSRLASKLTPSSPRTTGAQYINIAYTITEAFERKEPSITNAEMIPSRTVARSLPRAARSVRAPGAKQVRLQSTTASSSGTGNAQAGTSPFAAGVAGGLAAGGLLYGVYYFSPTGKIARSVNKASKETNKKYNEAAKKLQQNTPDADTTVNYIKDFCYSYVTWIPGGRQYIDTAFDDLEKVRKNNKEDADRIVQDAYKHFQEISKAGLSMESLRRMYDALADLAAKLADLSTDALGDVLDNHPQLKDKFGGSIDQLKQMGDQYGPEVKKQVNETWKQVRDIAAGGLTASNLDKARKLVEDKVKEVQKLGDEAWKKGLEQAKPYLDKNPQVKELVEKNADALKNGNTKELFERAKKAVESGKTGDLEGYVNDAVEKFKSKGSQLTGNTGLEQYIGQIPNGSEVLSKLQQLKEVAEKHTDESEKLVKETLEEFKKVLENKSDKAEGILKKAKEESK